MRRRLSRIADTVGLAAWSVWSVTVTTGAAIAGDPSGLAALESVIANAAKITVAAIGISFFSRLGAQQSGAGKALVLTASLALVAGAEVWLRGLSAAQLSELSSWSYVSKLSPQLTVIGGYSVVAALWLAILSLRDARPLMGSRYASSEGPAVEFEVLKERSP